jgi:hypothetical protein
MVMFPYSYTKKFVNLALQFQSSSGLLDFIPFGFGLSLQV